LAFSLHKKRQETEKIDSITRIKDKKATSRFFLKKEEQAAARAEREREKNQQREVERLSTSRSFTWRKIVEKQQRPKHNER
jgi:hypothetical protein